MTPLASHVLSPSYPRLPGASSAQLARGCQSGRMDSKLAFLLLFSALIIPAQFHKHDKHGKHDKHDKHGQDHGRGLGRGHGHDKKSRPTIWHFWHDRQETEEDKEYDYEATDAPSEEDDSDWLDDIRGSSDKCDPNPCLNNGVCEEKKGKFKCDCPRPYKGRRCHKAHRICRKNRCGHGQCVLTSTPPYYECKCKHPFLPPDCRTMKLCDPSPCQNGASCIEDGRKFECVCPDTFSGKFCQVGPDDCREGDGESYRGQVSETEDGDDCLFWNSHFILDKGTDPFSLYEDANGLGPHNHCRNPDGDIKPWCFTRQKNKLKWDYCNVKECPTSVTTPAPGEPATDSGSGEEVTQPGPIQEVTPPGPVEEVTISGSAEDMTTQAPVEEVTSPGPVEEVTSPGPVEEATPPSPTNEPEEPPAPTAEPTEGPTDTSEIPREFATCGKPQPRMAVERVYGGAKAIPGANPWQASVQIRPKGTTWSYQHTCGGVLIKPCWVLTAGHCINVNNSMRVVMGDTNLMKYEPSEQAVEVEETILHEHYREAPWAVYNDIALLKLKGPKGHCVKETKFVKTACLPNSTFPDGTKCTISGWGSTETNNFGSNQLLDAKVLLIPQERCKAPEVYGGALDDTMFCAGYLQGIVDSCQGDSGGPLVCEEDEVHYVYGLVSWGDSCAKKNKPGVYTRLTAFRDWIDSHISAA